MFKDEIYLKYDRFAKHIISYLERRDKWSLAQRSNLSIKGNNTNNIVEAAMRILKDQVFYRF